MVRSKFKDEHPFGTSSFSPRDCDSDGGNGDVERGIGLEIVMWW